MQEILHLINEMSPYLLLGFFLAGIMHAFLPGSYYGRFLGKNNFGSVVNAALFGIPLPLCSCGVIPTAMSLRKEGASRGATTSFLIATPQTGIDSIIATYSLMGLPFALVRPFAALTTSLLGGALVNAADKDASEYAQTRRAPESAEEHRSFFSRVIEALRYAFVEMMEDIGRWLAIGLVIAGLITVFIPDGWFTVFKGNTFASMLLVLAIAMPMYVCATGSIPVAVALMLKGLTPGAALVLLMAGPACNFASMLVVRKVLGMKTTIVYLLSIVAGAIGFGCLVDYLQFAGSIDFLGHLSQEHACCSEPDSVFSWVSTGALAALLVNALLVRRFGKKHGPCSDVACDVEHDSKDNNCMETRVFHIKGMSCNHCRMSAEKALLSVEGVTSATVDLASGEARIEGTAGKEELEKAIAEIGFTLK